MEQNRYTAGGTTRTHQAAESLTHTSGMGLNFSAEISFKDALLSGAGTGRAGRSSALIRGSGVFWEDPHLLPGGERHGAGNKLFSRSFLSSCFAEESQFPEASAPVGVLCKHPLLVHLAALPGELSTVNRVDPGGLAVEPGEPWRLPSPYTRKAKRKMF